MTAEPVDGEVDADIHLEDLAGGLGEAAVSVDVERTQPHDRAEVVGDDHVFTPAELAKERRRDSGIDLLRIIAHRVTLAASLTASPWPHRSPRHLGRRGVELAHEPPQQRGLGLVGCTSNSSTTPTLVGPSCSGTNVA